VDAEVMAHLDGPRDATATAEYMERNLAHWDEAGYGVWIVCRRSDERIVGRAVLRRLELEDLREVELGYALHREFWGLGYATEIAGEIQRLGLEVLGLPSVVAMTRPANLRSQSVLRRIGMAHERDVPRQGVVQMLFRSRPAAGPGERPA
jgi:RimJ/RimL family protein N-acetyltransferase